MKHLDLEPRAHLDRMLWRWLPGSCVLCHLPSRLPIDLCEVCFDDLPWNDRACERCALPLERSCAMPLERSCAMPLERSCAMPLERSCATPLANADSLRCAACDARPPPFSRTIAPLVYDDVVAGLVHAHKFRGSTIHGRVIATLLAARVRAAYASTPLPSAIVPVPLSMRRLLRRGQNQAAAIARRVGATLGIPVDYDGLRRIRHTAPQSGMTRAERLRNLAGAFAFHGTLDGTTVAVVDDVVTTGATVRAVARCLGRAGAGDVHVWAVARTDRDAL